MPDEGGVLFMVLLSACIFGAGVWVAVDGYHLASEQAVAMRTWPPAPAVVTGTNVSAVEGSSGSQPPRYRADVYFTYAVGGVRYNGSTPTCWDLLLLNTSFVYRSYHTADTGSYEQRSGVVAKFAAGEPATAYYDPAAPGSRAFLLRDVEGLPYLEMIMGTGVAELGIVLFALAPLSACRMWQFDLDELVGGRRGVGTRMVAGMVRLLFSRRRAPYVVPAAMVAAWGSTTLATLYLYVVTKASGGVVSDSSAKAVAALCLVIGEGTFIMAFIVWVLLGL